MTNEWVRQKNEAYARRFDGYLMKIVELYNQFRKEGHGFPLVSNIELLFRIIALKDKYGEPQDPFDFYSLSSSFESSSRRVEFQVKRGLINAPYDVSEEDFGKSSDEFYSRCDELRKMCMSYYEFLRCKEPFNCYEDSGVLHLDGDIIITDPCYLSSGMNDEQSDEFDYYHLEEHGIIGVSSSTIYGDWSCTTFNMDTKEPIGEFCADGGMVCVADLSSVLKFNPLFDYHTERTWTTTLIKNFCGDVQIKIKNETGVYEDDSPYHKKGDEWSEYVCYVEGHGVDKETGAPINFITSQTGL